MNWVTKIQLGKFFLDSGLDLQSDVKKKQTLKHAVILDFFSLVLNCPSPSECIGLPMDFPIARNQPACHMPGYERTSVLVVVCKIILKGMKKLLVEKYQGKIKHMSRLVLLQN